MPQQRTVVGTVADIAERVEAAGIGMPALTIVGEVVRLREQLRWFDTLPLFGKRVLVTRSKEQAGSLSGYLRDAGAMPVEAPTIRIVPPADPGPLHDAVQRLSSYDVVVLTSQNAVDYLFAAINELGLDARAFGEAMVCAVGPRTAEVLASYGVKADLMPKVFRGVEMARALLSELPDPAATRVLLPRARIAKDTIPDALRAAGAKVDIVAAYDTLPPNDEEKARILALVRERDVDAVAFTSSSTVDNLCDILGADAAKMLDGIVKASIGPDTSATAVARGIGVDVVAETPTAKALVEALVKHFVGRG
jgi:uroporphyrinogen III methyltransferase/synthase